MVVQATRGGKKRAPIELPKKDKGGASAVNNELFAKLRRRRQQEGGWNGVAPVIIGYLQEVISKLRKNQFKPHCRGEFRVHTHLVLLHGVVQWIDSEGEEGIVE